jgi:hypothetical protein
MFLKNLFCYLLLLAILLLVTSCDGNKSTEDTPQSITQVTLTFTPEGIEGTPIQVTATDRDGIGVQTIVVDNVIDLKINTTYTLSIRLINSLFDPTESGYDVSQKVNDKGTEYQFFFSWTGEFTAPTGDGNIDNRLDTVNYNDEDANRLPIGLSTRWTTTGAVDFGRKFRIILKHKPNLKTATSTSLDGETDLAVEFVLNVIN